MTLRSMWVLTGSNSRHNRVAYFGRSNTLLTDRKTDGQRNEFILVGLATLTGSSRLILGGLDNQKKLVPPG